MAIVTAPCRRGVVIEVTAVRRDAEIVERQLERMVELAYELSSIERALVAT